MYRVRGTQQGKPAELFGWNATQEEALEVAALVFEEYADLYDLVEVIDSYDRTVVTLGERYEL